MIPSITNIKLNAIPISRHINQLPLFFCGKAARQILEKLAVGADNKHIANVIKCLGIGIQATGKPIKLGILVKSCGIYRGGQSISLTANCF